MILAAETIHRALSTTKWMKLSEIMDYLWQCGPLAFADDQEYVAFRKLWFYRNRYNCVYYSLRKWHGTNVDCVLGDDKGNEVRVYMYVPSANPIG